MVGTDATWECSNRDKAPMTEVLVPPKVQDASESSRANLRSVEQRPLEREAYPTMDVLKTLMSTMTDTILQQITEQVKQTMETVNSARPLPTFDYVPTAGCEQSHRHAFVGSHH